MCCIASRAVYPLKIKLVLIGRDEIAECSERAYSSLSIPEAKRLMLFSSDREVASYAEEVCHSLILATA